MNLDRSPCTVTFESIGEQLTLNAVAPGYIPTGMNRMLEGKDVARLQESIPLARVGSPDEIAGVISFLTSPDVRYMQGETVVVDGGWLLG
jgi:NAD(P)-dependent dehydrogenase (short-subunit alcohol dehydrogenase family)